MKSLGPCRYALAIGAAAALTAGCAGPANLVVDPSSAQSQGSLPHHHTFYYTGMQQHFVVPENVTSLQVIMRGAGGSTGAGTISYPAAPAGRGGRVTATVPVIPGERLFVRVGGAADQAMGGFNGGADGGAHCKYGDCTGYGGGGASDVREHGDKLSDRILVAAGGGGAGGVSRPYYSLQAFGGNGGGLIGADGGTSREGGGQGGTGGTQSAGGTGGEGGRKYYYGGNGADGALGLGGAGGSGDTTSYGGTGYGGAGGGGGGGGYYGGGGGGAGSPPFEGYGYFSDGGGGGGGSSYVEPTAIRSRMWRGWKNAIGNGLVVFSWQ